jgi:cation diffusion facilitator family transporter
MREKTIIRTSIIGILANLLLAGFKAAVGLFTHSIAIVMDAVNNLSDALSSVITIIGTRLAGKAPDKKHPLGHGRTEYLTAAIISLVILYAGVTAFIESVKKIIDPVTPEYTPVSLVIVAVAVAVKLLLGRYVKAVGKRVNSDALVNSGEDARLDAVISASTLAAAAIYLIFHVSLEAWLGAAIALLIIKAGVDMLRETISRILGERVDSDLARELKATVASFPDVTGAYDLILHSYGPELLVGSVHIEVPDTYTADQLDHLEREIVSAVYEKHHVALTGISVYARNTGGGKAAEVLSDIRHMVMSHDYVLQIHGFHYHEEEKEIQFDVVLDFAAPDRQALYQEICQEVRAAYPDHAVRIVLDADTSD